MKKKTLKIVMLLLLLQIYVFQPFLQMFQMHVKEYEKNEQN